MTEEPNKEREIILIGTKPFMNYINSIKILFIKKGINEVVIRARGKAISKAVDVAEATRKRFLKEKNIRIKEIKIDSEKFENKMKKEVDVSSIQIILRKS